MALPHNNVGWSTVCNMVFPNHTHLVLIGWLDYNCYPNSLFPLNQNERVHFVWIEGKTLFLALVLEL